MARVKRWHVLQQLIEQRGCTLGAELGVYTGATLFHLLDHCPDLIMIGVDSWEFYPGSAYTEAQLSEADRAVADRARQYAGRCSIMKTDTAGAARWMPAGSLDFVFVDADHSTESVLKDIDAWLPKLKPGGFMAGHDIDFPTVREAVEQHCLAWSPFPDDVWLAECADIVSIPRSRASQATKQSAGT